MNRRVPHIRHSRAEAAHRPGPRHERRSQVGAAGPAPREPQRHRPPSRRTRGSAARLASRASTRGRARSGDRSSRASVGRRSDIPTIGLTPSSARRCASSASRTKRRRGGAGAEMSSVWRRSAMPKTVSVASQNRTSVGASDSARTAALDSPGRSAAIRRDLQPPARTVKHGAPGAFLRALVDLTRGGNRNAPTVIAS
jgi:hypothetical protein